MINALMGAAGAGSDPLYINDYFNQYAYKGNATNRSIVTNIDMTDGKSMVWIKDRTSAYRHNVQDTERGAGKLTKIGVGQAKAQNTGDHADHFAGFVSAFNNNGFSLEKDGTGSADWAHVNKNNDKYIAWTFKAAKGFFDIVTFSTDGTVTDNNRRISHDLEAVPGMIILKRLTGTDTGYDYHWYIYHRNSGRGKYSEPGELPTSSSNAWGTADPTTTDFGIKESVLLDANSTYVAYVFAAGDSDAEVFGTDEDQEVIKCGSIGMSGTNDTNTGSSGECSVNLGWEPDFVLLQGTEYSSNKNWRIFDRMRGMLFHKQSTSTSNWDAEMLSNSSGAETTLTSGNPSIRFTNTGFDWQYGGLTGASNNGHIWMAIRKSDGLVGKPPTGTDAFNISSGSQSDPKGYASNFPSEFAFWKDVVNTADPMTLIRSTPNKYLSINQNYAELTESTYMHSDDGAGIMRATSHDTVAKAWMWRSGPGLNVINIMGNGSAQTVQHNLGAVPEMIWAKNRHYADQWMVYHKDSQYYDGSSWSTPETAWLQVNTISGAQNGSHPWGATAPTATHFTFSGTNLSRSGEASLFILFSSVTGFSKCGGYTGNGSTQSITTGFSPRMVIIKAVQEAYGWMFMDTVRGWGSGNELANKLNDPWGHSNNTAPANTQDFGAPTSTGFDLTNVTGTNTNNKKYIYYAVA